MTVRRGIVPAAIDARIAGLRPVAGGAPPATRPKRGATRPPAATRPAPPPPVRPFPRRYVLLGYVLLVFVGQTIAAGLSSRGVGGGQLLALTSFLWIALALPFWALAESPSLDLRPSRLRT